MDVMVRKKKIRQEIRAKVAALDSGYCQQADQAIATTLFQTRKYQDAGSICCYVGTEREIDTAPILLDAWKRGKTVGVPRCVGKGVMEVCQISSMEDLEPGSYGILEPGRHCRILSPEDLELIIVPCLACTKEGVRLGHGGGYYDRYLTRIRTDAAKIVLCRERILCEEIPQESHDVPMDLVVMENSVIFCQNYSM